MNILFTTIRDISSEKWAGANRIFELIRGLRAIDDDIQMVLFTPNKPNLRLVTEESYLSHRDFKLLRSLHYVSIVDEANPFRLKIYLTVIKKYKVDIIQNEFLWGSVMSSLASRLTETPLIIDEHNFEAAFARETKRNKILQLLTSLLERRSLELADHILTLSETDKNLTSSAYNIPADKFSVVPFSVNTSELRPVDDEKKSELKRSLGFEKKYILIFHGRSDHPPNMEALRYIEDILLPKIIKHIPNVQFLIVGMNSPKSAKNTEFLKFTGFVNNLHDYLSIADSAVVPIVSGSGVRAKIIEYASCGVPIVATFKAVEGLEMKDGINALLSKKPDQKMIDNILMIHGDAKMARRLSNNAKVLAVERHDTRIVASKLREVYVNILNEL